jgi:hypothetical protein
MKKISIIKFSVIVILNILLSYFCANRSSEKLEIRIETNQFKLLPGQKDFILQSIQDGKKKEISIPRAWLIPPEEERAEEDNYVSSFNYSEQVTSFPLGNGQIALHLSSYQTNDESSVQVASGRDLFLIYDTDSSSVREALDLGVTKERIHNLGCFEAKFCHFLLSDINEDEMVDIGVFREEILCDRDKEGIPVSLPYYKFTRVQWYIFKKDLWEHDVNYDEHIPENYTELPLLGMKMSTIDFVAYQIWKSYIPSEWHRKNQEPVKFVPASRRKLIKENSRN